MSVLSRTLLSVAAVRRNLAVFGSALILFLSVLTANPQLHQLIHGHDGSGGDDGCAVVMFAGGVSIATDTAVVAALPAAWQVVGGSAPTEILLASPRCLHPPGQAPPAS